MMRSLPRPSQLPCRVSFPGVRPCLRCLATQASPAVATPPQLPRLIIAPGSVHHNSLPSFLEYADRVNLAPTKTVYVGTHYEYVVALSLLRLGFSLLRTGRKSDAGIDLIGHWVLPPLQEPLPVIVQCKARKSGLSPKHIRELEGAFQGIPAEWRRKNVLGLLVTTCKATRGVLEALGGNRWPMAYVKISRSGTIEQFLWNRAATEKGLEGVGVTVRHTPRILLSEEELVQGEEGNGWEVEGRSRKKRKKKVIIEGTKKDIQLTWLGNPIFPDREGLDRETMRLMDVIAKEVEEVENNVENTGASTRRQRAPATRCPPDKSPHSTRATNISCRFKGVGRPPASLNQNLIVNAPRKRGRPLGSKNKAKFVDKEVD